MNHKQIRSYIPPTTVNIRKTDITNVGEDVKQQKLPCVVGGNVKWHNHFGKKFGRFLKKLNLRLPPLWSSNSTPKNLPERNESVCPPNELYNSISSKLEIAHVSINTKMDKESVITFRQHNNTQQYRRKGREKGREGNIDVREEHWSVCCLSYVPHLGTEPATQACALSGNPTCDLLLCGMTPNRVTPVRAGGWILKTLRGVKNSITKEYTWWDYTYKKVLGQLELI